MKKSNILNYSIIILMICFNIIFISTIKVNAIDELNDQEVNYLNTNKIGWQTIEGNRYYFDASGRLVDKVQENIKVGWNSIDGKWYYYDSQKVKKTGWMSINGSWYYFNEEGIMQTGMQKIGNDTYYFEGGGVMQTGWQKIEGKWYYFESNGKFSGEKQDNILDLNGWQLIGNNNYYIQNHTYLKEWQKIEGKWYYFDTDGIMQTGWKNITNSWNQKYYYYFGKDGVMQTGWQKIESKWYYFEGGGVMQTGWQYIPNQWNEKYYYYFGKDGAMQTGWCQINWKWYYFSENGIAIKGNIVINGIIYYFRDDYSWISNCSRKQFVDRAKSYLGCNEQDGSFKKIIDSYNKLDPLPRNYYAKYTDSWCMIFISAIARECNILDIIPIECSCGKALEMAQAMHIWQEDDSYIPQIGDIIMYDWDDNGNGDNTGWPDHVGVVAEVNGDTFKVIEGNKNDAVGYRTMSINGKFIRGFITPEFLS